VTSEELGGKDVTGTLVDLDARLRSLRAQEDALNALLGKARTVGETLQVAQAAGEIRTQIEQLAAQQAQLSDQADYATITVQVLGPHASSLSEAKSEPLLVRSFRRAGAGALALVGGVIVVLGYALPLGLMGAAGYLVWRGLRRRRIAAVA
jgi:prefoldin subunit 5